MITTTPTAIPGLRIIRPRVFQDRRGYFFESYNARTFAEEGIDLHFVQDNESCSVRNVIRGLHYQLAPHAQTKLLRVTHGVILDVVVDLRKHSPAYGTWLSIPVSADDKQQLLIPKGCAHGFRVVSAEATVFYRCDTFYHPDSERSLLFRDETLAIDWGMEPAEAIVSDKDRQAPRLADADNNYTVKNE